jgi:3-deoxy-D-manno-octulosonic acid (KDO) 8-phosphate synthase
MSTYTPCFPPSDPKPKQRHLLISSTSSGTSASGGHASFSARLSKAHLALASVSEYIERPPSPTSAAVDSIHVAQLRRKFRLAVAAAYRDTSSGKWAHVSELARLGCTIGRWQGVCSGSKAPPPSTGDRNDQGELFQ